MKKTLLSEQQKQPKRPKWTSKEQKHDVNFETMQKLERQYTFRKYRNEAEHIEKELRDCLHQIQQIPQLPIKDMDSSVKVRKSKTRKNSGRKSSTLDAYQGKVAMYERLLEKLFLYIESDQQAFKKAERAKQRQRENEVQQEIRKYKAEIERLSKENQVLTKKVQQCEWLIDSWNVGQSKKQQQMEDPKTVINMTGSEIMWAEGEQLATKEAKKDSRFGVPVFKTIKISHSKPIDKVLNQRKLQVNVYNVEATDLKQELFEKQKVLQSCQRKLNQMKQFNLISRNFMSLNSSLLKRVAEGFSKSTTDKQADLGGIDVLTELRKMEGMLDQLLGSKLEKSNQISQTIKISKNIGRHSSEGKSQ